MINYFSKLKHKLQRLRKRAKRKGIDFNLNRAWIAKKLNQGYCEVTGIRLDYSKRPFINPYYLVH